MKVKLVHKFEDIISVNNLLEAWKEFLNGKKGRKDVQEFQFNLMDNILSLHQDLINRRYRHGGYQSFNISDPKPRIIHKASVRDRLLHRAVYRILYPFFERTFIPDSFSCRINKGTHRAINRFYSFACEISNNHTETAWVLKCDIKKFFVSIDHKILVEIIKEYITDENILWLLKEIIGSFSSAWEGIGLPLGNLTSQLFSNIYMNKFDQFVKHKIEAKQYVRYADDFVILSQDKKYLLDLAYKASEFLENNLKLTIHPDKISIRAVASGIDFLGWVIFPDHKILRTATKKRMMKRIKISKKIETLNSYFGLLKHGNAQGLKRKINAQFIG
jgi:retron-type reverse transcriptase